MERDSPVFMRVYRFAALSDTSVTKQPVGTKLGTVAVVIGSRQVPLIGDTRSLGKGTTVSFLIDK